MFLDTNIENYYITMVNLTIHARCLIRNKKEKNEEYYFLLASKRSWANVFYSLLEKYIKKKITPRAFYVIQLNLSTMATSAWGQRKVAVVEKFK